MLCLPILLPYEVVYLSGVALQSSTLPSESPHPVRASTSCLLLLTSSTSTAPWLLSNHGAKADRLVRALMRQRRQLSRVTQRAIRQVVCPVERLQSNRRQSWRKTSIHSMVCDCRSNSTISQANSPSEDRSPPPEVPDTKEEAVLDEIKPEETQNDEQEYPGSWKLALITIGLCLSVFCLALVRLPASVCSEHMYTNSTLGQYHHSHCNTKDNG